jgi:hypothetical protein
MRRLCLLVFFVSLGSLGCSFREPSLGSSDPALKVPAIKAAVQQDGTATEKQLVGELDNDDPAIRLYAISGLERLTGQRFGYEYYHNSQQRQEAIKRWEAWLAGREDGGATTQRVVTSH